MPEAAEATRTEGYTALEARLNHDGTVALVVAGEPLTGCGELPMDAVLDMLVRYARENGTILLASTHPNGRVTHDLVTPEGEVTPYYPTPAPVAAHPTQGAEEADPAEAVVFDALRRHGRRRAGEPVAAPATAEAEPLKTRVQLGAGDIPRFNVEADIEKALAAKNPPRSRTKALVLAVLVAIIVLGAVAAAGWLFLTHGSAAAPHAAALWAATGPPAA